MQLPLGHKPCDRRARALGDLADEVGSSFLHSRATAWLR